VLVSPVIAAFPTDDIQQESGAPITYKAGLRNDYISNTERVRTPTPPLFLRRRLLLPIRRSDKFPHGRAGRAQLDVLALETVAVARGRVFCAHARARSIVAVAQREMGRTEVGVALRLASLAPPVGVDAGQDE